MARRLERIRVLLQCANEAYHREQNDACLILLYSVLDVLGTVSRAPDRPEADGADFRRWVSDYVLSGSGLSVTAEDLWGARCGIVHALSQESRRSARGHARVVVYVRGEEAAPNGELWSSILQRSIGEVPAISKLPMDRLALVHLGSLLDAVNSGFETFSSEIIGDLSLDQQLTERMDEGLTTISVHYR